MTEVERVRREMAELFAIAKSQGHNDRLAAKLVEAFMAGKDGFLPVQR